MRFSFYSKPMLIGWLLAAIGCSTAPSTQPIPLDGFSDAIHHWYNRTGRHDAPLYSPGNTHAIADNILLYQRENGGWPENTHPQRILDDKERAAVLANKDKRDASFDNRNIYPQVTYLSYAYQRTGEVLYRKAALAGLRYTLEQQYSNGGWPHSPDRMDRDYGRHITFADEIMPGVLGFLRSVAAAETPFEYIPEPLRQQASDAVTRGDALVLQLQIHIDGKPTIWAGQYDRKTLESVAARSYELPALQAWESVAVVEYLMSIPSPSKAVIHSVESAVNWFKQNRIDGIRLEQFDIEPVRFEYHTATYDRRIVKDPDASPLWARFYDLETSEPFFTNRDGSRVSSLEEVALERRSGYDWYGDWPAKLLETDYPAWRARLDAKTAE